MPDARKPRRQRRSLAALLFHGLLAWVISLPALAAVGGQASPGPLSPASAQGAGEQGAWRFRVYLDDREIGYHHFFLADNGETRELRSVADFEVRLLFVTLYDYQHENVETWAGDCLHSIASRTDANGTPHAVDGRRLPGGFRVEGSAGEQTLPECVMSFAYWNPAFLRQERLLNTQSGEFLDVKVSDPVEEALRVRGERRPALRYRLEAGELSLVVWYSADNEWLALESEVAGGRMLRYELI